MGMAKLNIWVSGMDNPCMVDDKHTWFVTIYTCDGNVLQWCGKRYVVIPAKCGHVTIDVPPGFYYVKAVWSYSLDPQGVFHVNHYTDAAIVEACCERVACVRLFNPSVHRCGTILVRALHELTEQKLVSPDAARKVEAAVNEALAAVPKPAKGFELDHLDTIKSEMKESMAALKGESKKAAK